MDGVVITKNIINSMLAHNRSTREQHINNNTDASVDKVAREFKTIAFSIGRQKGSTKYIVDHANEEEDIIIVRDSLIARFICDRLSSANKEVKVITIYDIMCKYSDYMEDLSFPYKTIYVEGALKTLSNKELSDRLYNVFATDDIEQSFILLG